MSRMRVTELVDVILAAVLVVAVAAPVQSGSIHKVVGHQELQEGSYTLTQLPEDSQKYSLVLSDDNERVISGSFSVDQLQILRAVMVNAAKFAMTGESVGTQEPITTRFMDKQEPSFIVDVQKLGLQTSLFVTLNTEIGRVTLLAGKTTRGTKREDGFFFRLLSQLEAVLPKVPDRPAKPSQ